jgi:quercetin dioxygenase-like cupin family protein
MAGRRDEMRSVLESAARTFQASQHIRNLNEGDWIALCDEYGSELRGIRGRMGACSVSITGHEIGADLIEMQPGSLFPHHVHAGDHVLYVLTGIGCVSIDSVDHVVKEGDTIFIPAEYPHGVKTVAEYKLPFIFLAFGHPHAQLDAKNRMRLVK